MAVRVGRGFQKIRVPHASAGRLGPVLERVLMEPARVGTRAPRRLRQEVRVLELIRAAPGLEERVLQMPSGPGGSGQKQGLVAGERFDRVAGSYRQDAVVQQAASDRLLELLGLGPEEDVIELGCGPGHLTQELARRTSGRVLGVDRSSSMIAEARASYGNTRPRFEVATAERLRVDQPFDAIFCNSAFHWFTDPRQALLACARALRPGGRMAVQAPARSDYCPEFVAAVAELARDPATARTFAHHRSPWFLLETAREYAELFEACGFSVPQAEILTSSMSVSPELAKKVFDSGAALGYLDPRDYAVPWPPGYLEACHRILEQQFRVQAGPSGRLELRFFRVYLLAINDGRPASRTGS